MKLLVANKCEGMCVEVSSLSVHSSLTFGTIQNTPTAQNMLLKFVKKGIISSFEIRGEEIKVSFFTKFVQEIA
jgi:hypothetical protein